MQTLSRQGISVFGTFLYVTRKVADSDHIVDPRVAETKARLEKVKDEFERYKLKAEAVLKAKVFFKCIF